MLDRAIDALIDGRVAAAEPRVRVLLHVAAAVRAALPVVPPGVLFEDRLAGRLGILAGGGSVAGRPLISPARAWAGIRSHPRFIITGAVGSAAVSVAGVTALAVWRAAHRQARAS